MSVGWVPASPRGAGTGARLTRAPRAFTVSACPAATLRPSVLAERALVGSWGGGERGRALWKIGALGGYPVQLVLTETETALYHTDERMAV